MSRLARTVLFALAACALALAAWVPWHPNPAIRHASGIVLATLVLWISEAAPLGVVALGIPVAAAFTGVLAWKDAVSAWGDPVVFLFLGTFLLARALDKHGVFEGLAHLPVFRGAAGGSGLLLCLGVMLFAGALSSVQNNTAVTAMLLPVVMTLARQTRGPALSLLALAFGSTFGGMSTPVGTAPNFIGFTAMKNVDPAASFLSWMKVGVPVWLGTTLIGWGVLALAWRLRRNRTGLATNEPPSADGEAGRWFAHPDVVEVGPVRAHTAVAPHSAIETAGTTRDGPAAAQRGPRSRAAFWSILAFAVTALLWLGVGAAQSLTDEHHALNRFAVRYLPEQLPPILTAWFLFLIRPRGSDRAVLDRHDFQALDWDTLFLIAGGLCLGKVLQSSGASNALAAAVAEAQWPPLAAKLGLAAVTVLLSELTSNTATASLMIPIAGAIAPAIGAAPSQAICLVALSASLGFALPVSTPPNAIIYGTRQVPLRLMVATGLSVDVLSLVWVVCCVNWLA